MIKECPLLKVQSLKKSHAGQIEMLPSDLKRIVRLALMPNDTLRTWSVLGWIGGETLKSAGHKHACHVKYWLLHNETSGQYFWDCAPSAESDAGKTYSHVPQLFI